MMLFSICVLKLKVQLLKRGSVGVFTNLYSAGAG